MSIIIETKYTSCYVLHSLLYMAKLTYATIVNPSSIYKGLKISLMAILSQININTLT